MPFMYSMSEKGIQCLSLHIFDSQLKCRFLSSQLNIHKGCLLLDLKKSNKNILVLTFSSTE